jgi:hypothetical protein
LHLVEPDDPGPLPSLLNTRSGRKDIERLTHELVGVLVEMMDLVDCDADLEPNGDEFEDGDEV